MPQFLYIIRRSASTPLDQMAEAEKQKAGEHFAYLQEQLKAGKLILAGRTQDEEPIGLVIYEADDQAAAEQFFQDDPAVQAGVFKGNVHPFAVALSGVRA